MGEMTIPCKDCKEKTRKLEKGGANKVISCEPIPNQAEDIEPKMCLIKWKVSPL